MKTLSIRPFIGAENFEISRQFYQDLGFEETVLMPNLVLFQMGAIAFYLQDAYVKDWVDNTMVFVEVEDLDAFWNRFSALDLTAKYEKARLVPIQSNHSGEESFLCTIRPGSCGILEHFQDN